MKQHAFAFIKTLTRQYNATSCQTEKEDLAETLVSHLDDLNLGHCIDCKKAFYNRSESKSYWCSMFHRSMPATGYCHEFVRKEIPDEAKN